MVIKAEDIVINLPLQGKAIIWGECRGDRDTWFLTNLNMLQGTIWCNNSEAAPGNIAINLNRCQVAWTLGLVKQQNQNLQPKLNVDRKLLFCKILKSNFKQRLRTENNTYKQDLCSSESFCAIRPTIGIKIFKCLLVNLVISSPFNLIKYSIPVSSATPRTSWHSDQVPVVNVAWLPADTWNKIRNNAVTYKPEKD